MTWFNIVDLSFKYFYLCRHRTTQRYVQKKLKQCKMTKVTQNDEVTHDLWECTSDLAAILIHLFDPRVLPSINPNSWTPLLSLFFYREKENISFKLIKYITINTNIAKNIKDKFVNKLTSSKLKTYNNKIPTNNMIKSKSSKSSCFQSATLTLKSLIELVID